MVETLYESMFIRKSTRKFKEKMLETSDMEMVLQYIQSVKPLLMDSEVDFSCVSGESIKGAFGVKAPHYLVVSAKEKKGSLMNVGYMLQQVDLFLSHKGIGGCWVGMAKPDRHLTSILPYPFVIAYAFGYGMQSIYQQEGRRSRKSLKEISEGSFHTQMIEAARIAPSATNSQPWHFVTKPTTIDVYRIKNNPIKGFFLDRMNEIDIGIALYHLELAALKHEMPYRFFLKHYKEVEAIHGYLYQMSIEVNA